MSGRARLFFASMPPPAWREQAQARVAAHDLDRRLRGAMFAPGNWHQSWSERVFDPTPAECDALLRVGAAILAHACTLHFNRIDGSGDEPGRIHWTLRARGRPRAFDATAACIRTALADAGHAAIATGVTPHMTLSYCARETLQRIALDPPLAWTLDELLLVVGAGRPYAYEVIGRWPLLPETDPPATQMGLF
ncbi:2'-5' RNA ligase family protein [Xanthomonas massiliensis]|jgi:2'-5' RNA ligase|uniref:2'-5' RNA ligase family protein n=1 Tax=Xanthomonas massiliensis TaxID=1720302 RepID=UPI000826B1C8|nr:2'-5' RNA ligase family protein [Xanthomonas massiliensis]